MRYTEEMIIDDIRRINDEQGCITKDVYAEFGICSPRTATRHTGKTFTQLLKAAFGEEYSQKKRRRKESAHNKSLNLSKEDVLNDFRRLFLEHGDITAYIVNSFGICSMPYLFERSREFGTFNELREEAVSYKEVMDERERAKVIEDVKKIMSEYGLDKITKDFYVKEGKYSKNKITRLFGSWNKMLLETDLPVNCLINIPEQDLLDELVKLNSEFGTISATIVKDYGEYCIEVYQRRFGSFNNALEQAGIKADYLFRSSPSAIAFIKRMSSILNEVPIFEYEDEVLINPLTGRKLYVDAYFPKSNIAVEYHGPQHYEPVERYGGEEGLSIVQERDAIKQMLLRANGFRYFEQAYNESREIDYLTEKINSCC